MTTLQKEKQIRIIRKRREVRRHNNQIKEDYFYASLVWIFLIIAFFAIV